MVSMCTRVSEWRKLEDHPVPGTLFCRCSRMSCAMPELVPGGAWPLALLYIFNELI